MENVYFLANCYIFSKMSKLISDKKIGLMFQLTINLLIFAIL